MSKHVHIQLPDGQIQEYPKGITIKEAAGSISSSLQKKAAAGQVNGKLLISVSSWRKMLSFRLSHSIHKKACRCFATHQRTCWPKQ